MSQNKASMRFDDRHASSEAVGGGVHDPVHQVAMPDVPFDQIKPLAGHPDAEEQVEALGAEVFDAANAQTGDSPEKERAHRERAECKARRQKRGEDFSASQPEILVATSREAITPKPRYVLIQGIVALSVEVLLVAPIPVVVGNAVYEAEVTETLTTALFFGLPVLGAIMGVSLIRKLLTNDWLRGFDAVLSLTGLGALGLWAWQFSQAFLTPISGNAGFGEGIVDLSSFYAAHLLLEATAAASLHAIAERCFLDGLLPVAVANPVQKTRDSLDGDLFEERLARIDDTDTVVGNRARKEAAKAAYVKSCLSYLAKCQTEREAAIARAKAEAFTPKSTDQ